MHTPASSTRVGYVPCGHLENKLWQQYGTDQRDEKIGPSYLCNSISERTYWTKWKNLTELSFSTLYVTSHIMKLTYYKYYNHNHETTIGNY